MALRVAHLETFDGYESPTDDFVYDENYMFLIEGYSIQIQKGFFITERGEGINFKEALDNAYSKIYNRLYYKYHIVSTTMKTNEYWQIESNNKLKGTGFAFYTMDEMTIEQFKEEEENYQMTLEDGRWLLNRFVKTNP